MAEKIVRTIVTTKEGRQVRMNEAALKMAEKHFGVIRSKTVLKETPIELLKVKKEEIIKGIPKLETPPIIEGKQGPDESAPGTQILGSNLPPVQRNPRKPAKK